MLDPWLDEMATSAGVKKSPVIITFMSSPREKTTSERSTMTPAAIPAITCGREASFDA